MARVTLHLPGLLAQVVDGRREVALEAETVEKALASLVEAHPQLSVHLFEESGDFRPYVLCFHNDSVCRREELGAVLSEGDTLRIMQAVSGG